jgi:hypothetical protein
MSMAQQRELNQLNRRITEYFEALADFQERTEARLDALESKPKPGRPPKEKASNG